MSVNKFKMRKSFRHFRPKSPNAKISFSDIDVVEQDHTVGTYFGKPGLKIMTDIVVCVQTVYVKKVNTLRRELIHGLVKGALNEARESSIQKVVMVTKVLQYFRPVES